MLNLKVFIPNHSIDFMPEEIRRRLPSMERSIIDIRPETDVRVKLIGTILDATENTLILDDGTGKLEITFDDPVFVNSNQLVKVIARIIPMIDGFECKGEVLQVLDKFDLDLYRKARDIIRR